MKGSDTMSISLEEAKNMMTMESISKLKDVVNAKPTLNMDNKAGNDILMQALCRAVSDKVIHAESLNDRLIKLLNSATNSLSQMKLGCILSDIRNHQHSICCVIYLMESDMSNTIKEWVFTGPVVSFNGLFEYVIDQFNITPQMIRNKVVNTLKPAIVNNIAQLVAKYNNSEDTSDIKISINTISRIVNMTDHLLFAEFKEMA